MDQGRSRRRKRLVNVQHVANLEYINYTEKMAVNGNVKGALEGREEISSLIIFASNLTNQGLKQSSDRARLEAC